MCCHGKSLLLLRAGSEQMNGMPDLGFDGVMLTAPGHLEGLWGLGQMIL